MNIDDVPVIHEVAMRRFELRAADGMAWVSYQLGPDEVIIDHTWVPEGWRGRGIAAKLVTAVLDEAQRLGWRVVPECSYVAAFIERHPEYRHLLA